MKSIIDLDKLLEEINSLDFWKDGSGADMAVGASVGIPDYIEKCPTIMKATDEACFMMSAFVCATENISMRYKPRHVMINRVPAGIVVPFHTDPVLDNPIRCHLPVITNDKCFWWDEMNLFQHMKQGEWYVNLQYKSQHTVGNLGSTERIHLVVDILKATAD